MRSRFMLTLACLLPLGCHFLVSLDDVKLASQDAGLTPDATAAVDGGPSADTGGAADTGSPDSGGSADTGESPDTSEPDVGAAPDTGPAHAPCQVMGDDAGGLHVENAVVALHFTQQDEGGTALGSVRVKRAGTENVLYAGTDDLERLAGISYYPVTASWKSRNGAATATEPSPVVEVTLPFTSAAADGSKITGTSVYTIHPDGRVHRREAVTATAATPPASLSTHLLAYVSIDYSRYTHVEWQMGTDEKQTWTRTGEEAYLYDSTAPVDGYLCARSNTTGLVVGWAHHDAAGSSMTGARSKQVGSLFLLLATDWVREAAAGVADGTRTGSFLTVFDATGTCDTVAAHTAAFLKPPTLTATRGSLRTTDPGDQDQDGYSEGGGYYSVIGDTNGFSVSINGLRPTTTLRIDNGPITDPTVSLGGTTLTAGTDYLWGASDTIRWLFLGKPWSEGELSVTW